MGKKIIPAILVQELSKLKRQMLVAEKFAEWVQIDIMDGILVNNKSVSLAKLEGIRTRLKLEAHLMVVDPEQYVEDCRKARIKRVIFHHEGTKDPLGMIKKLDEAGMEKGVAVNPETTLPAIKPYLNKLDMVLIMGVNPGWSGQKFLADSIKKIGELRRLEPRILIAVDGGVNAGNIGRIAAAGADFIASGSGIFAADDPKAAFSELSGLISEKARQ